MKTLVIDGHNIMGAAVGGWWRDPRSALLRIFERLRCYVAISGQSVVLVLDVTHPDLPDGDYDGIGVRSAGRRGRDAADDRIIELLETDDPSRVEVVTSDRILAQRARRLGASVTGAGRFLARLGDAGC